jgi:hypothetical protein
VVQEEEAFLMVAMVTVVQGPTKEKLTLVEPGSDVVVEHNAVEIHEEKVSMQLRKAEASRDGKVWILDIGGTNHMTGSGVAFVNLDTRVRGTVQFRQD